MTKRFKVILLVLAAALMVPSMTGLVGAGGCTQAPCHDFFYQDPLPISDWPVLSAADTDTAWAVSLGGLILKTDDGGKNWQYQWSELQRDPDTPPLRDICAVSPNVAWICGDGGAVLVTADGGETWSDKSISVPAQDFRLLGISAPSGSVAWAVGQDGSVYRTADGGDSWASVPVPGVQGLLGVSALSDQCTIPVSGTKMMRFQNSRSCRTVAAPPGDENCRTSVFICLCVCGGLTLTYT